MSEAFIFIGTHRVKEGRFESFKKQCAELAEVVEANEPRMMAFNIYANEEGSEVSVVQLHPDADSMLFHMNVVREHITDAYSESLDATTSIQVYGTPSDTVLEMIRQFSSPDVPLSTKTHHLGGFTRSADDRAHATSQ